MQREDTICPHSHRAYTRYCFPSSKVRSQSAPEASDTISVSGLGDPLKISSTSKNVLLLPFFGDRTSKTCPVKAMVASESFSGVVMGGQPQSADVAEEESTDAGAAVVLTTAKDRKSTRLNSSH